MGHERTRFKAEIQNRLFEIRQSVRKWRCDACSVEFQGGTVRFNYISMTFTAGRMCLPCAKLRIEGAQTDVELFLSNPEAFKMVNTL